MGSLANSLINLLLGWTRQAAKIVWNIGSDDGTGFLMWMKDHWLWLTVLLCLIGLVVDFLVYLYRWQPVQVWLSWLHRMRHHTERQPLPLPQLEEEKEELHETPAEPNWFAMPEPEMPAEEPEQVTIAEEESKPRPAERIRRGDRHRRYPSRNVKETQNNVAMEDAFHKPTYPHQWRNRESANKASE